MTCKTCKQKDDKRRLKDIAFVSVLLLPLICYAYVTSFHLWCSRDNSYHNGNNTKVEAWRLDNDRSGRNAPPHTDDSPMPRVYKKAGACYLYNPFLVPNCSALVSDTAGHSGMLDAQQWRPSTPLMTDSEVLRLLRTDAFYTKCFDDDGDQPVKDETEDARLDREFALAVVVKVHRSLHQLVQFLQTMYRRQDTYCITYDLKSSEEFQLGVRLLAARLPNVVSPDRHERIVWAHISELHASVNCLRTLDRLQRPWRYVLDQVMVDDLPLKTSDEIAGILRRLNGTSNFGGFSDIRLPDYDHIARHEFKLMHISDFVAANRTPPRLNETQSWTGVEGRYYRLTNEPPLPPPPHNLTLYKAIEVAASRAFVHFVVTDKRAADLLEWMRYTYAPVEHYLATLYFNRQVHSFEMALSDDSRRSRSMAPPLFRYQVWTWDGDWRWLCNGVLSHFSCVFGVRDLPAMVRRHELFVHKLKMDVQPAAYHCLREYLQERKHRRRMGGKRRVEQRR